MPADRHLRVVTVYPELLGTYGDGGNAVVLAARARRRGIPSEVVAVSAATALPADGDIYCLGGGEDTNQALAATLLAADGGLARAVDRGAVVFGVCAGLQLLGHTFADRDGAVRAGLGLLDIDCARLAERAVGEVVVTATGIVGLPVLTGFENHRGNAVLRPGARALGEVLVGTGNGNGSEGVVRDTVVATYLHGPVLARNPALADHLIATVLGDLAPLQDTLVDRLRAERLSSSGAVLTEEASGRRAATPAGHDEENRLP